MLNFLVALLLALLVHPAATAVAPPAPQLQSIRRVLLAVCSIAQPKSGRMTLSRRSVNASCVRLLLTST